MEHTLKKTVPQGHELECVLPIPGICPKYLICVFLLHGIKKLPVKYMRFNMRQTETCPKYVICIFPVEGIRNLKDMR